MSSIQSLDPDLEVFRRQYLQLLPASRLRYPPSSVLKGIHAQKQLFSDLFDDNAAQPMAPPAYRLQVLKALLRRIEAAFVDADQDEISDALTEALARLMSEPPADALALQRQRSHVTYTFPGPGLGPPATVTLLESRGVLSAAGTTGLRTWEAAVHLAAYLAGEGEGRAVRGKRVLELGAGTGLVALACAKALGAARVAATDGSPDVVEALRDNIFVNGLQRGGTVSAAVLRWGRWPEVDGSGPGDFDVVVGADITYDSTLFPLLVSTLVMLLEENATITILIAATIRNEQTFDEFTAKCGSAGLSARDVGFSPCAEDEQTGPFYSLDSPIRIVRIEWAKGGGGKE